MFCSSLATVLDQALRPPAAPDWASIGGKWNFLSGFWDQCGEEEGERAAQREGGH
uniref:Uncharacterized protein n=1 Tax=Anguilla anguilla TaxID=7936 RepID=A0A0E9V600_ANGAN